MNTLTTPGTDVRRARQQAADALFGDAVAALFDGVLARPRRRCLIRAGAFTLDLAFASEALAEVYTAALLPAEGDTADVQIGIVDASDVDLSALVPAPADEGRTHVTDAVYVAWQVDRLPVLYVLDRRARRGFIWFAGGAAPEWELSRPACPLIHALTVGTPHVVAHGGAVSRDGRTLLLAGPGRAGKTTAALACARAGWDYAGDDYFFADTRTRRVEPLYASARLRADMGGAFADLLGAGHTVSDDDGDSRHELRIARWLARERIAGGTLAAFLLPRRRGATRPTFAPATRTDAFNALFKFTRLGLPGPMAWTAEKLTRLVALAPVYVVDTGTEPEAIPAAFGAFLDGLPTAS